jgi:hypothetical protein
VLIVMARARMWKNMAVPLYLVALVGLVAVAGGAGHISSLLATRRYLKI